MNMTKIIIGAIVGFIAVEIFKSQQENRAFSAQKIPVIGQIVAPIIDPIANTDASFAGYQGASMADTLQMIDANPGLVADITPQGQFRIDPRQTG